MCVHGQVYTCSEVGCVCVFMYVSAGEDQRITLSVEPYLLPSLKRALACCCVDWASWPLMYWKVSSLPPISVGRLRL